MSKPIQCQKCALASICLPIQLNEQDMQRLMHSVIKQKSIKKGQTLARNQDCLEHLFVIRAGAFKSVSYDHQGNINILDFYFPGELVGLDSLANAKLEYDLLALEDSCVCTISKATLFELAMSSKNLQAHMFHLMSQKINHYQKSAQQLNADEKVALFLLSIHARLKNAGLSSQQFSLPMTRNDIGYFLNLAPETVSRIFKKFEGNHLITISNRDLHLKDIQALHVLANYELSIS